MEKKFYLQEQDEEEKGVQKEDGQDKVLKNRLDKRMF